MNMKINKDHLKNIIKAVETQSNDEALWCLDVSIGEAYMQQALRDLHYVIEHNDEKALARIIDCQETSSGTCEQY